MEIIEESKHKITVKFPETSTPILSALRRTVIADVPALAVDTVDFTVNDTVFPNEFIAHRLGLLVLKSDQDHLTFTLDHTAENDTETITAGHLSSYCVHPDTPIAVLKQGQRLKLVAQATKGTGHAKWSPVCPAYVKDDCLVVESTGAYPAREIVELGLESLKNKLKHFDTTSNTNADNDDSS